MIDIKMVESVFILLREDDGEISVDSAWRSEEEARDRLRVCFLDIVREMGHDKAEWQWLRDGLRCYHEFVPYGLEIVKKTIWEVGA